MADKKMGLLQLILRLAVFLYIALFVMIWKKGYCARVPLTGSMRLTFRAPLADDLAGQPLDGYCCDGEGCAQKGTEPDYNGAAIRRPCWIVDDNFVTSITGDKATIATRIQRYSQTLPTACAVPNASSCLKWTPNSDNPSDDVYVAYVDRFTLSMTHGFTIKAPAQNEPTYFDLTDTHGRIVYTDNNDQQIAFNPCVTFPSIEACRKSQATIGNAGGNSSDIATIGMLLYAARIADVMDKPCKQVDWNKTPPPPYEPGFGFRCFSVAGRDNSLKTKRDIGATLNLIITYKNTYGENDWGFVPTTPTSKDMQYTVEAKYKYGASYSERRAVMGTNMTSRLYDTLTGIRINVIQTGTILVPDFVTTILNLMTGMGLLGVAAVVVGVMIESVLPVFQSRFGYGIKDGLNYEKAVKKAVRVIDKDIQMSERSIMARGGIAQELLSPADRT